MIFGLVIHICGQANTLFNYPKVLPVVPVSLPGQSKNHLDDWLLLIKILLEFWLVSNLI